MLSKINVAIIATMSIVTVLFSFGRTFLIDHIDSNGVLLGLMSLIVLTYEFAGSVLNFGGGNALVRVVSKEKDKLGFLLGYLIRYLLPAIGIIVIASYVLSEYTSLLPVELSYMMLIFVIFSALTISLSYSILMGLGETVVPIFVQSAFIICSFFVIFIWSRLETEFNFFGAISIALALSVTIALYLLIRTIMKILPNYINISRLDKHYFIGSTYIYFNGVLAFLFKRLDQILIASLLGLKELAIYYFLFQISELVKLIPLKFSPIILNRLVTGQIRNYRKISLIYVLFTLSSALFLIISFQFLKGITHVNVTAYYDEYLILLLAALIGSIGNLNSMTCISNNKEKSLLIVNTSLVVVQFVSSYFLIQYLGILGAVLGKALGTIIGQVGLLAVIKKNKLLDLSKDISILYYVVSVVSVSLIINLVINGIG